MMTSLSRRAVRLAQRQVRNFAAMPRVPLSEVFPTAPTPVGVQGPTNYAIQTTTLDNGLRVASVESHESTSVFGVFVDAGSRYEDNDTHGHAHFLERMAFRATQDTTSFAVTQSLEAFGCDVFATASREMIIYSAEVLRKFSDDAVHVLSDVIMNPAFHIHEINNVKYDYVDLIKKNALDAAVTVQEDAHEAAYGRRGIGLPLYASRRTLDGITGDSLRAYVNEHFTPNRMVVCGVGVDHSEFVSQISTHFGHLKFSDKEFETPKTEYLGNEVRVHAGDPTDLSHLLVAFETGSWRSDDLIASCVLQSLMGGGGSFSAGGPGKGMYSRLYLNVLNQYHWINNCNVFSSIHSDSGLFGIYGVCDSPHTKDLSDVIVKELRDMANPKLLGPEAFSRAKNSLRSSVLMNLETRAILCEDIGRQLLVYGKHTSPEEIVSQIDALSVEDVIQVAQKMLKTSPTVVVRGDTSQVPHHPDLVTRFTAPI